MWLFILGTVIIVLLCIWYFVTPRSIKVENRHVLITGASSGIGKALAVEFYRRKANVTLVARNQKKLDEAVNKIGPQNNSQKVQSISCDVSGDYNNVMDAMKKAESKLGPVDILINCAGITAAGRFEDVPIAEFQRTMDVNYIGSVNVTRAVIESMKKQGQGRIVFVSSQAGQVGLYGYTPYSPTKYALRGLAESLQMELTPYNIRVTLSFPPDTDTPGYQNEMKSGVKPVETNLISETSGLFKVDDVAKRLVNDTIAGKFQSYIGLDGWMLSCISAGMSPFTSLREFVEQVFLMGLLRGVALFYLLSFDAIVRKCKLKREAEAKKEE